jgi:hypothetical protein
LTPPIPRDDGGEPGWIWRQLDNAKVERELGWRPEIRFEDGLSRTVGWYRERPEWWRPLKASLDREAGGFWTGFSPTKEQGQSTKDVP